MNECWDPDKGRFWSPGIGDAPSELGVDRPDQVDGWIMAHPGTDNSPTEASAEPESPEVVTRDEIERMAKYLAQLAQDPDMSERRSQQLANAAAMLRGILR